MIEPGRGTDSFKQGRAEMTDSAANSLRDSLQTMTIPLLLIGMLALVGVFSWVFVQMIKPATSRRSQHGRLARLFQNGTPGRLLGQCILWILGGFALLAAGMLLIVASATDLGAAIPIFGGFCLILGAVVLSLGIAGLWFLGAER